MKKILVIMIMVLFSISMSAESWKNSNVNPNNKEDWKITKYERTGGYVALLKGKFDMYYTIIIKTDNGLFDYDYKTKVIVYDINNVETESYYVSGFKLHIFDEGYVNSEYKYLLVNDDLVDFIANGKGYVRFISETTFDGKTDIKVPCMNNGRKTSVKRKTSKNTPIPEDSSEKTTEMKKSLKEKQERVNKQIETQEQTNRPFSETSQANRRFYQENKPDYSAYNRQVNPVKKSKLQQNPEKAKKLNDSWN